MTYYFKCMDCDATFESEYIDMRDVKHPGDDYDFHRAVRVD